MFSITDRDKSRILSKAYRGIIDHKVYPYLSDHEITEFTKKQAIKTPYIEYVSIVCGFGLALYSLMLNYQLTIVIGIPIGASVGLISSDVIKIIFMYEVDLNSNISVPLYKKITIALCMIVSITAFSKVMVVNNHSIDLRIKTVEESKRLYYTKLNVLRAAAKNESNSVVSQEQIGNALSNLRFAKDSVSTYLNKTTWHKRKRVTYRSLITIKGEVCHTVKGYFTTKFCPKYFELKSKMDLAREAYISLKSKPTINKSQLVLTEFISQKPSFVTTASTGTMNKSAQVSIFMIVILGILAELTGFLFISRRNRSANIINNFNSNKLVLKKEVISLVTTILNKSLPADPSRIKQSELVSIVKAAMSDIGMHGNITNNHISKLLVCDSVNTLFKHEQELKDFLIKNQLIIKRNSKSYSYKVP